MDREPVQSTSLRSVGYDLDAQLLEIEFQDGRIYRYLDVPSAIFERLMNAPSKGQYFSTNIKEQYTYEEVR